MQLLEGVQEKNIQEVREHFKGFRYMPARGVVITADGTAMKRPEFKAWFGGYRFALNESGSKTTVDPWLALMSSHAFACPRIDLNGNPLPLL